MTFVFCEDFKRTFVLIVCLNMAGVADYRENFSTLLVAVASRLSSNRKHPNSWQV